MKQDKPERQPDYSSQKTASTDNEKAPELPLNDRIKNMVDFGEQAAAIRRLISMAVIQGWSGASGLRAMFAY